MGAVTYPDAKVAEFVNNRLIPIRLLADAQPYAKDFNIKWTPSIITLDESGKEHHRVVGFLPPEEFIPAMMLGIAKVSFDLDRFDEALAELERIIAEYPKSKATPEAIYLQGVSGYKSTKDPKPLKAAYEKLHAEYPDSEWAARALPYRLIS
jgi:tetratricopeptide (TPR) repeat protein